MKYWPELKRAARIAFFLALGIFVGTGVVPWIMEEDKAYANSRLIGSALGLITAFLAAVAMLFISEIMRTKRLEKKKQQNDKK